MSHRTIVQVTGMTCEHCVASVTEELSALYGVSKVDVDLVNGATSSVTIESEEPLADADVREAVAAAGYEVVS